MISSKPYRLFLFIASAFLFTSLPAQNKQAPKNYPSLLWEITGNGLKKPSYLFGTMHVSSKKAFHLSDSFFTAIRRSDVVALELNPDIWQTEMVRLEKEKSVFNRFYGGAALSSGTIKDYSFRPDFDFLSGVKIALQESPMIINSLLYRSRDSREDFEENTFLDMYIYQTGKKLGKRASGVENLFEMERLTTEAEIDRRKEKNKKKRKYNEDDNPDMTLDEAYRKGDLDILDSLQRLMNESDAYIEKFLYKRNELQAASMDTIMKKGVSLFAGVGAAHLAGPRGVIEELRRKGYKLRPIKMVDRDARQRNQIDNIRVPVVLKDYVSEDGFFKLRAPGSLYRRDDTESGAGWQFADMSNGAYYMVTRVHTLTGFAGTADGEVLQKIDSILYENVPGKILKKTTVTRNGYPGIDIVNKTRRGDVQRYLILVTPFEVLLFKMSGNENYVLNGKEANEFFNSITLMPGKNGQWTGWQPANGGFSIQTPHIPYVLDEGNGGWTIAAADPSGMQYLLLKQMMGNYNIQIHDTLNLALMEESFTGAEKKLQTISRKFSTVNGAGMLTGLYSRNDSFMAVNYVVNGPHYYLLAAKGVQKDLVERNSFTHSFRLTPLRYGDTHLYTDTFVKFSTRTPIIPRVRDSLKALLHQVDGGGGMYSGYGYENNAEETYSHYSPGKSITFFNDTTGESVSVSMSSRGRYYFTADSLRRLYRISDSLLSRTTDRAAGMRIMDSIWQYSFTAEEKREKKRFDSLYILLKNEAWLQDGAYFTRYDYTDSFSSTIIRYLTAVKGNYSYTVNALSGKAPGNGSFVEDFIRHFTPLPPTPVVPVYVSKIDTFFNDYYSADTSARKLARSAIQQIKFERKDISRITGAISKLSIKDKDYFETKLAWIAALGGIADSTAKPQVLEELKKLYAASADTSLFQNALLKSLAGMETTEALAVFKKYLLDEPPVEISGYEYSDNNFMPDDDSLDLVRTLFPELLRLTAIEDYKPLVNSLLVKLVDSNRIAGNVYENYFDKILFDARIALKKQQRQDEKQVQEELSKEEGDTEEYSYSRISSSGGGELADYATLLLPFYQQNPAVPKYIDKLWQTRSDGLKFALLLKMLPKNLPVPDTLINYFAGKEEKRGELYYRLAKLKLLKLFPAAYRTQAQLAQAFLYTSIDWQDQELEDDDVPFSGEFGGDGDYQRSSYSGNTPDKKFDSIARIGRQWVVVEKQKGWLYIYKYRRDKDDKWRFALSGLQPEATDSIAFTNRFTTLTDTKIKDEEEESLEDQIRFQVKKAVYARRAGTRGFFTDNDRNGGSRRLRYFD